MKKFFCYFTTFFLFTSTSLFFSCASKDQVVNNNENQTESLTKSESEDLSTSNNQFESEDNTQSEDSQNDLDSKINIDDFPTPEDFEEVEVIDEPIVIDFPEMDENKTNDKEKLQKKEENQIIIEEKIEEFETLEPLESLEPLNTFVEEEKQQNEKNVDKNEKVALENFPIIEVQSEETSQETDSTEEETETFEESELELLYESIVPSRKITINLGEKLIITYPGVNWKFYGITDKSKDLELLKRTIIKTNTAFEFVSKKDGTKILHFYKLDNLTQNYIDDFIEIQIISNNESDVIEITDENEEIKTSSKQPEKTVKKAPEYKKIESPKKIGTKKNQEKKENPVQKTEVEQEKLIEEKQIIQNKTENQKEEKSIESKENVAEKEPAKSIEKLEQIEENIENKELQKELTESEINSLLTEAQNLYNQKKYKDSLQKVQLFLEYSPSKRDDALFLQAQLYETQSEIKDIKKAINIYNTIINNYPTSKHWDNSNKRVIYLNRFYLKGR